MKAVPAGPRCNLALTPHSGMCRTGYVPEECERTTEISDQASEHWFGGVGSLRPHVQTSIVVLVLVSTIGLSK